MGLPWEFHGNSMGFRTCRPSLPPWALKSVPATAGPFLQTSVIIDEFSDWTKPWDPVISLGRLHPIGENQCWTSSVDVPILHLYHWGSYPRHKWRMYQWWTTMLTGWVLNLALHWGLLGEIPPPNHRTIQFWGEPMKSHPQLWDFYGFLTSKKWGVGIHCTCPLQTKSSSSPPTLPPQPHMNPASVPTSSSPRRRSRRAPWSTRVAQS